MKKSESAYKTISEVAKLLNLINPKTGSLNTHTLRFWETQFKQLRPKIFSGKRRYYDKKNIDLVKKIKFLLKEKGMTISGVKKILNNSDSFNLDEISNKSISNENLDIKNKIKKISNLIKSIKDLK